MNFLVIYVTLNVMGIGIYKERNSGTEPKLFTHIVCGKSNCSQIDCYLENDHSAVMRHITRNIWRTNI